MSAAVDMKTNFLVLFFAVEAAGFLFFHFSPSNTHQYKTDQNKDILCNAISNSLLEFILYHCHFFTMPHITNIFKKHDQACF